MSNIAPTTGAWELARQKFSKEHKIEVKMKVVCVCSHDKYHHRLLEEDETSDGTMAWGACSNKDQCGCEYYEEMDWNTIKQPYCGSQQNGVLSA